MDSPLWIDELSDSFHLNFYFSYIKEWDLAANPLHIDMAFIPNIALGTRDIYIEPETIVYFGRKNKVAKSVAYNRVDAASNELYFSFNTSYRYVLHNGLIDGNLLGDNSPLLKDSTNSVWRFGIDFNYRFKRSDYKLGANYVTRETSFSQNHRFIRLSYGYRF